MPDYDAVVVGAGIGGLYAIHRLREAGLSVLGLESAGGVGGVWYHNRYPGARVDVESFEYCYYFSPELYREWRWTERYAAQPELLAYLNHVADKFDLRRHILFQTPLKGARWDACNAIYHVEAETGLAVSCRFLVMATGNLSAARPANFPGLASFKGQWAQTSNWPSEPVELAGRRCAVVGTGSSGIQVVPVVAEQASQLYVFQRTANFSVPAQNGKPDHALIDKISENLPARRAHLLTTRGGLTNGIPPFLPFAEFSEEEQEARLEHQWALGGQGMNRVFSDQGTNQAANDRVSNFVRAKIRQIVDDPDVAELLCPYDHPIGSRRLCLDTNYYATFNRDNVTLVDSSTDPILSITPTGIQTANAHYEVDLIIFALGFNAFRGILDRVDIRNEKGEKPTDTWDRGPQTYLGLMTAGFPNLFLLTGPGSPSTLANLMLLNEEHINLVAEMIGFLDKNGFDSVEPELAAQEQWRRTLAQAAGKLLRLGVKNYMVHVNEDDGSRIFIPYVGGLDQYTRICREIASRGFEGFRFQNRQDHPQDQGSQKDSQLSSV